MFLLINKPKGMTSHDVVDRVRRLSHERKVGHGGTLDPNATGLLVVAIGRESTKKLDLFTKGMDKTYEAEMVLGQERDTDDVEGEMVAQSQIVPTKDEIMHVLDQFKGEQSQVPPSYSAIKKNGQKAYALARRGKAVELEARKITIKNIKLLQYNYPRILIEFEVSSGTYIRALARDIGRSLQTYAYLSNLKRTKVGKLKLEDAAELNKLTDENWKKYGI